jgi:hypothetical protein
MMAGQRVRFCSLSRATGSSTSAQTVQEQNRLLALCFGLLQIIKA